MNQRSPLSSADKLTVGALVVAALGVVIQIAAGAPYPAVPPAFFVLLIPAALIAFVRWRWAPLLAVLSGLFLTVGLFAAGQTSRLTNPASLADSLGLWIQTVAVLVAAVGGVFATRMNLRRESSAPRG